LQCDRLILIGGGIGITALLPFVSAHVNAHLSWSVKQSSESLVSDLNPALDNLTDKTVLVGQRIDIDSLLSYEAERGWKRIGVVVCGPGALCDDVRAAVTRIGRQRKAVFELEVDAFSW